MVRDSASATTQKETATDCHEKTSEKIHHRIESMVHRQEETAVEETSCQEQPGDLPSTLIGYRQANLLHAERRSID